MTVAFVAVNRAVNLYRLHFRCFLTRYRDSKVAYRSLEQSQYFNHLCVGHKNGAITKRDQSSTTIQCQFIREEPPQQDGV